MDVLLNLRTFVAVARYGGFSEAARQLHVVPSVAAKRVAQLEKVMGTRLFERSTRKVALTESGHQLLTKAGGLLSDFDDLVKGFRRDATKLQGHLRVMAPTTLTQHYLGDAFNAFLREHERITLEIALIDGSISPLEEGFDLAISGQTASFHGVTDEPLCPVDPVLCASPDYVRKHGAPLHPGELAGRDCLVFRPSGPDWQFQSARGMVSVQVSVRLLADDNRTLCKAAQSGLGIAVLPGYVAKQALDEGALQALLPEFPPQETWFKAYVPNNRWELPRVQALLDWLRTHLRALPVHAPTGGPANPPTALANAVQQKEGEEKRPAGHDTACGPTRGIDFLRFPLFASDKDSYQLKCSPGDT